MSDLWDLRLAVVQYLATVEGLPPVYDVAPKNAPMPRGTFGPPSSNRRGHLGGRRSSSILILDWWGVTREVIGTKEIIYGDSQVMRIAGIAKSALDGVKLPLAGSGTIRRLRWEMDLVVPDPNVNIRHLQQRFNVGIVG